MRAVSTRRRSEHSGRGLALVRGSNEIASAVAVYLLRDEWSVILSHDPNPPVIRRKMAFHDVLFGDAVTVDGISAARADTAARIFKVLTHRNAIAATWLGLLDMVHAFEVDLVVDARMQKYEVTPNFRSLAGLTIGLGPGFFVNANCDIAIETRPARNGAILWSGKTDDADRVAGRLGCAGSERFAYAESPGRWHTSTEIGASLPKGAVVGFLDGVPVTTPLAGIVRGLVRDGINVPSGGKLLETDPRGQNARWTGIDERGGTIAQATLNAIRIHAARRADASRLAECLSLARRLPASNLRSDPDSHVGRAGRVGP